MRFLLISLIASVSIVANAQNRYEIEFPRGNDWNLFKEGSQNDFDLKIKGIEDERRFTFSMNQGKQVGMLFDSSGHFSWLPDYNVVDRIEKQRIFQVLVEAKSDSGDFVSRTLDIYVDHTNRPPVANELKPFYIQYNTRNKYQIDPSLVFDEDMDPLVFIPSIEELPEGMNINSRGEVTWSPSYTQFKDLQDEPIYVSFSVEDQPFKDRTGGRIKLMPTQLDLPPAITVLPKTDKVVIKEQETINIGFYLSDPNGDEDIEAFDFLSNNSEIKKQSLVKNTQNQYEFFWTPDYNFVQDPADSVVFYIDFFVIDKTQKRDVKRINFRVNAAINEAETDKKNYALYRGTLTRA